MQYPRTVEQKPFSIDLTTDLAALPHRAEGRAIVDPSKMPDGVHTIACAACQT